MNPAPEDILRSNIENQRSILLNLTPHPVTIFRDNAEPEVLPPFGFYSRVSEEFTPAGELNGIPLFKGKFGQTNFLPPPQSNVYLIVSKIVRQAHPERLDLLSPGEPVYNEKKEIIGCRTLITN